MHGSFLLSTSCGDVLWFDGQMTLFPKGDMFLRDAVRCELQGAGSPARSLGRAGPRAMPHGGIRFMQSNQNLLYLVLKCGLNTKHSGSRQRVQALFDAQKRGAKTAAKTVFCGLA